MGVKHDQISGALNKTTTFPWHGIGHCSDGSAVLIFPFLRATWELQDHNSELDRDRRVKWKDVFVSGHFQDRWFRVLYVLDKIASMEATMKKSDREFAWINAHQELPLWLDLLHFYIPMLLDALVVALGRIISDAPDSFPREFKKLFRKDVDFTKAKLRCDEQEFRSVLSCNREWHDKVRPVEQKSTRDSIVHRLSKWQVGTRSGVDQGATDTVTAQLQGEGADLSPKDGLRQAEELLTGLCDFLSALPPEIWIKREFDRRELITAPDARCIGGRFLRILPDVIHVES